MLSGRIIEKTLGGLLLAGLAAGGGVAVASDECVWLKISGNPFATPCTFGQCTGSALICDPDQSCMMVDTNTGFKDCVTMSVPRNCTVWQNDLRCVNGMCETGPLSTRLTGYESGWRVMAEIAQCVSD